MKIKLLTVKKKLVEKVVFNTTLNKPFPEQLRGLHQWLPLLLSGTEVVFDILFVILSCSVIIHYHDSTLSGISLNKMSRNLHFDLAYESLSASALDITHNVLL